MPINVKKISNLSELPKVKYEGYYWLSDQKEPRVLLEENLNVEEISSKAFIIEALLYAKEEQFSVHIQHHGEYLIRLYELINLQSVEIDREDKKDFIPHNRLKAHGIKSCKFIEYWAEEFDNENTEAFPVLVLKATIFNGFTR
jgi:CRISPR type III-associated protein (TIGR04423 family)